MGLIAVLPIPSTSCVDHKWRCLRSHATLSIVWGFRGNAFVGQITKSSLEVARNRAHTHADTHIPADGQRVFMSVFLCMFGSDGGQGPDQIQEIAAAHVSCHRVTEWTGKWSKRCACHARRRVGRRPSLTSKAVSFFYGMWLEYMMLVGLLPDTHSLTSCARHTFLSLHCPLLETLLCCKALFYHKMYTDYKNNKATTQNCPHF